MSDLPVTTHPISTFTIPSSGKKVRFRPFLVSEEKILLMAREGKDSKGNLQAIKQVITNCVIDKINVDKLTSFDLELFFIRLRAVSVNNIISPTYKDKEDGVDRSFDIDLNTIEVTYPQESNNKIKLDNNLTLVLKYPPSIFNEELSGSKGGTELIFNTICNCLDSIYSSTEEKWDFSNYTLEQRSKWVETLTTPVFEQIELFVRNQPVVEHTITYKNNLGHDRKVVLRGLDDFFTWG